MTRVRPPLEDCPKCGRDQAFYTRPLYHDNRLKGAVIDDWREPATEHLDWRCWSCGYTVQSPVLDGQAA